MKVFASSSSIIDSFRSHVSCGPGAPVALFAAFLLFAGHSAGADFSFRVTGNLLGSVMDVAGIPQMGATVQLLNKYDHPVSQTATSADGRFAFAAIPVDVYSVRVSMASFLPAGRDKIAVKAGLDSVLRIHLATLFSNIQVSYVMPDGAMSDDWKWVLRSSPATRPITRYLPLDTDSSAEVRPRIFSGTRAMLSVSGGEGGLIDTDSGSGDFGTGFALSTNILGKNQLQVGGSLGQGANLGSAGLGSTAAITGPVSMGLCAIYTRNDSAAIGGPPEITFAMAQIGTAAPQVAGFGNANGEMGAAPALRTMSLSIYKVTDLLDDVRIEYGMTGESVDYLQHASRISPFARVTVTLGNAGEVVAAYSDGGRPDELTSHQQYKAAEYDTSGTDLIDAVNTLARLPQISERNGRLELERSQNYELGYRKTSGSRTYAASAFLEHVSNGRMNVAGNLSALDSGDLFQDGVSATSTYNIGTYQRRGYIASLDQRVNAALDLALAYGRMGGFTVDPSGFSGAASTHENFLNERDSNVASANLQARVPGTGTKISANYGWVDSGAMVPRHIFTTENLYVQPGLNLNVRQPLPSLFGLPGRLEITADLRNLLAQGYLPINAGGGQTLLIVQSPFALRGGLNFIF